MCQVCVTDSENTRSRAEGIGQVRVKCLCPHSPAVKMLRLGGGSSGEKAQSDASGFRSTSLDQVAGSG